MADKQDFSDGFANFVTAVGGANAKTARSGYTNTVAYTEHDLATAYDESGFLGKIIDIPADDATREWREWKADRKQIEAIEATEKRLGVQQAVNSALKKARLYGGSAILADLPGSASTPLNLDRIAQGGIRYLHVVNRYELHAEGLIRNPLDPNYGRPEWFYVTTGTGLRVRFHPSRVVVINGRSAGMSHRTGNEFWGKSVWNHVADSVLSADGISPIITTLLQEVKRDVIGIDDFMASMMDAEGEAAQVRRWQLVATLSSIANITLMDKADEWQQKTINMSGVPDSSITLLQIMCGVADIPLTRMLGTSPGGLNATGESDLRNYYDNVRARQGLEITPALTLLDEIILRDALGSRPASIWYEWHPLWQPSDKERAETQKIRAETFAIELGTAALDAEAFATSYVASAIESGLYAGLDQAIAGSANAGLADPAETTEPTDPDGEGDPPQQQANDAAPRSLYVSRPLLNPEPLLEWAREQGFTDLEDASELHVTLIYSRQAVDWLDMGQAWEAEVIVPEGGPRVLERFNEGAVVLAFASSDLEWRHRSLVERGASFDFDQYQPHVTLTYNGALLNLEGIEPYQGELRFGPERFAELKTNG